MLYSKYLNFLLSLKLIVFLFGVFSVELQARAVFVDIDTVEILYFAKQDIKPEAICFYQGVNSKVECKGASKDEAICMLGGRNNRFKCNGVKLPQAICMLGGGTRGKSFCQSITDMNEAICLTDINNTKSLCKGVTEAEAICLSGGRGKDNCRGVDIVQAFCMYKSGSSKTSCTPAT